MFFPNLDEMAGRDNCSAAKASGGSGLVFTVSVSYAEQLIPVAGGIPMSADASVTYMQ